MLKKLALYTSIYIVVAFVMSYDEIQCAFDGEELCWVNLIGKFIIFVSLIFIFDKFIKKILFTKRK